MSNQIYQNQEESEVSVCASLESTPLPYSLSLFAEVFGPYDEDYSPSRSSVEQFRQNFESPKKLMRKSCIVDIYIDDFVCWNGCESSHNESVPIIQEQDHGASYAQVVGATVTLAQGKTKTGRIVPNVEYIKPIRPFLCEEIRVLQSRVKTPDMFVTKSQVIEKNVSDSLLDQEIMKFFQNLSVGFTMSTCWVWHDGLVRKGQGTRCTKCQGVVVKEGKVLDQPCICVKVLRHYASSTMIPKDKSNYLITLSPGHRLGNEMWKLPFEVTQRPCGFASELVVDSVSKNDTWICEMLAMYGPHLFSFTTNAFVSSVLGMSVFGAQVGGLHPNICESVGRMVCNLPNKRIVLAKLCSKRTTFVNTTICRDVTVKIQFRHPFVFKKSETFAEWRKKRVSCIDTVCQGDDIFEIGDEVFPDTQPIFSTSIDIPCTTRQSDKSCYARLERMDKYYCQQCNIECTSEANLQSHCEGARHFRVTRWNKNTEFGCDYCKITVTGEENLRAHRQGEKHRKMVARFCHDTDGQGFVTNALAAGSTAVEIFYGLERSFYDALEENVLFQKVYEIYGGRGMLPDYDRTFLCQLLPFLMREKTHIGWAHMEFLYLGSYKWLTPHTVKAYRWISCVYNLWTSIALFDNKTKDTEAQGVGEALTGAFKVLIPGFELSDTDKKNIGNDLRTHAMARSTIKDFWSFGKVFFEWLVSWFHDLLIETPASIKKWLIEVDAIDEVLLSDDGNATTLKVRMAKFHEQRRKIYQLLQTGKDIRRKLETIEKDKFSLKIVGDRIKKLEAIVAKNAGSFVGAEGKLKPHVIYFWGLPKAGKSALVDHFYSDLFHVLGEAPYNPAVDRYTINPITPYHDTYRYNRVVDFQDLLQVKAEETRQTELYDLIHMADESPFPLNVAECSGKGSIYFCSEHMVVSSNFDLGQRVRDVVSLVESHEAIMRRIDIYAQVMRSEGHGVGYDRSQMTFKVGEITYNWDEFLLLVAKSVLRVRAHSMGVTSLEKNEELVARLDAMRSVLTSAQGFDFEYKRKLIRKIDELEAVCTPSSTETIITWLGSTRVVSPFLPYGGWEMSLLRLRGKFASTVATMARFIVNWSDVMVAGATLFTAWKAFSPQFGTLSEGMPGRSGGESEFNVRRQNLRNRPKNVAKHRAIFGEGAVTEGEGCLATNMAQVRQVCVKNLGMFKGGRCVVHYFGVFDRVIVVPLHAFVDPYKDVCAMMVYGFLLNINMAELDKDNILVVEDNHMVFINLTTFLKAYAPFADIKRRLYKGGPLDYHQAVMFTSRGDFTAAMPTSILIENVKALNAKLRINMKTTTPFLVEAGIEGYGYSEVGDCGAPWVLDHPTGAVIVGLHVGGTADKQMHAASFDEGILSSVMSHFRFKRESPVVIEAHGTEYDPPDDVNTVEVLGITDEVFWHIPRVSKIRKSVFHGIREPTTAPAQLKPFLLDKNGVLEKVSPLVLNFRKGFVNKISLEPQVLDDARRLLEQWYFPLPEDQKINVLTIEEAVFGDPFEVFNKSINPQASIGWPWCERFTCRRELLSLKDKTIHPTLVSACARLLAGNAEEFLFVDMLKDERLPLAKVASGKTRVFTVLPVHLNIVLKQLFGRFVMYMQSLRHCAPVKVGLAQTPDEWGKLWKYINNGGEFVAGDYSAFDKVLHYEVVMMGVDIANRFYADEYQELRKDLVERVFNAFRYVDGVVYQTYGGMPSGCYLTASFNSLANAAYWFSFLVDSGIDTEGHKDWFKVATYGDDHIVAIRDRPILNQVTFSKWLHSLGMTYTTAIKGEVVSEYTLVEDLSFLKRGFRKEGAYMWAPMPEENLMEMVQWYRNTQTTKQMLEREIGDELLSGFELEAVHLGKERYDVLQQELLSKFNTKNKRTFEQSRTVFLSPLYLTNFTNMNGNTTIFKNELEETSCEEVFDFATVVDDRDSCVLTQGQGNEDDAPLTSETFLGETKETVVVKGLTKFVDQVVSSDVSPINSSNSVIDGFFEIDTGYFDMCKRWFKVGTQSLGSGDPTGYPLIRIDPTSFLVNERHINTKLNSTTYARYVLEIQIKLVSTKFHYGALMCVWRPYYAAGLLRMAYSNRASPNSPSQGHWWLELPSSEERDGPYDNIHTASQSDHQILSVTARNTVTMTIPWNLPYQYVPVEQMLSPRYHPGFVDIYALTPIGPSNLDSPEILVFAAFKELQGWGYKSYTNVNRIAICKYLKNANIADATLASNWNVPVPQGPALNLDSPFSWKPLTISGPTVIYDTIAQGDPVSEQKAQSSGSWLLDAAMWVLDKSRTVLTLISPLGPILGFFGLSRPPDSTPVGRYLQSGLPMSNGLGPDVCYSTAINPLSLCTQDSSPEDKLLSTVAGKLTYLGYLTFESGNMDKQTMTFSPMAMKISTDRVYFTPASFITSRFRYWRTNIKFHFRFYSSSFVSTRMALFVQYKWVSAEQGLCPTKIVDIAGDTEADVEIPFLYDTPWYDKVNPLAGTDLYNVSLQPLTDIVSDEAVAVSTKPVYCTVWISFPGLQVAGMGTDVGETDSIVAFPRIGKAPLPTVRETFAQGDEDLPALGNAKGGDWAMNDLPASLYHLSKRYYPASASKLKPWMCTLRKVKEGSGGAFTVCINDGPFYLLYASMFRFFRSSVNVIGNTKSIYDLIAPYGAHFRDGPDVSNWSFLSGFVYNPKKMCQVRLPYRTNVSYLPTPVSSIFYVATYITQPPGFAQLTPGDWTNPCLEFKPIIDSGGAVSDPPAQLYVAAGDDLVYHTFIGVPCCCYIKYEALLTTFDETLDSTDTIVQIANQPIEVKMAPAVSMFKK